MTTDYHKIHPVAGGGSPSQQPDQLSTSRGSKKKKPSHDGHDDQQLPVTAPPAPPRRRNKRRCCRCVCWTLLAAAVLAVALGATAGILYLVFRPKIPSFHVDRLTVARFDVNATSMTVHGAFDVDVTATNPNRRIGVYYGGGGGDSEVTASFNGTELCRGAFPALYQGHRTTVRPRVSLAGETRLDSAVAAQLLRQQRAGFVPLTVRARVPVRIKFGAVRLWKMTGKADCELVADSLHAGTRLRIRSNTCRFKLKL